jgi:hypothetical protein
MIVAIYTMPDVLAGCSNALPINIAIVEMIEMVSNDIYNCNLYHF